MSSWGAYSRYRKHNPPSPPTFHVLIATIGRPSLRSMLDSLKNELGSDDAITIVFDGKGCISSSGFSNDWIRDHSAHITVIEEENKLGYWGHGIRNKYQGILSPKTTYVMNADDDDVYLPASFRTLRLSCIDPSILYLARIIYTENPTPIPSIMERKIIRHDIATPCGIIPFDKASSAEWKQYYGGDFDYYDTLQHSVRSIVFLYHNIYMAKSHTIRA